MSVTSGTGNGRETSLVKFSVDKGRTKKNDCLIYSYMHECGRERMGFITLYT